MRRWLLWLPLVGILLLGAFLLLKLQQPRDEFVHSAMIGKPLPAFAFPAMIEGTSGIASKDYADGKPRLINLFGSWCAPCIAEAPQLEALKRAGVEIDGVALHDTPKDVGTFLSQHGNPYRRIGDDRDWQIPVILGSTGVPETYVIGGDGRIAYQHIGEIRPEHVQMLLKKLRDAR